MDERSGFLGKFQFIISKVGSCFFVPFVGIFLYKKWQKLRDDEEYADKYEGFIDGFRLESRWACMYNFFFLLRRLGLGSIILFFPDNAGMQVICLNVLSTLMIMYVISVFPNKDRNFNYIEIINEESLKVLELFLIIFSDFNPDPLVK